MFTNLPEDVITNTLHFDPVGASPLETVQATVQPLLETFYEAFYANNIAGNYVKWAQATTKWYALADPEPRVPIVAPMPLTITTVASTVPTEAAVVLSFQGDPMSGVPMARRRGRLYMGGLGGSAVTASTTSQYPMLNPAFITQWVAAASNFAEALDGVGVHWSVWSTVDQASTLITNGWIDNAIDTQRRRGVDRTARTTWTWS